MIKLLHGPPPACRCCHWSAAFGGIQADVLDGQRGAIPECPFCDNKATYQAAQLLGRPKSAKKRGPGPDALADGLEQWTVSGPTELEQGVRANALEIQDMAGLQALLAELLNPPARAPSPHRGSVPVHGLRPPAHRLRPQTLAPSPHPGSVPYTGSVPTPRLRPHTGAPSPHPGSVPTPRLRPRTHRPTPRLRPHTEASPHRGSVPTPRLRPRTHRPHTEAPSPHRGSVPVTGSVPNTRLRPQHQGSVPTPGSVPHPPSHTEAPSPHEAPSRTRAPSPRTQAPSQNPGSRPHPGSPALLRNFFAGPVPLW
jgi:hypothetical protein